MVVLALINLRGVGESVKFNVVLTLIEMAALAIVIAIGFWVMASGDADLSRITSFTGPDDVSAITAITIATAVAFFAMVGFEDSVNMVEETKHPEKCFPRAMMLGLGIAALIYVLVAIAVVSVLSLNQIAEGVHSETGVLLTVVQEGVPDVPLGDIFPFMTVFAVANTALINMLMASRLIYGMAKQDVLPRPRRRSFRDVARRGRPSSSPPCSRWCLILVVEQARGELGRRALRDHRAAAAVRVRRRQRLRDGAARQERRTRAALPAPTLDADRGGDRLPLPRRALGAPGRADGAVQGRGRDDRASAWSCGSSRGFINKSRHQATDFEDIDHLSE